MYKVFYTPYRREPISFGSAMDLYTAQELARLTLVEMNVNMYLSEQNKFTEMTRYREAWRLLAERAIKLHWKQESDTIWIGIGYDGGSIVSPELPIIRIEREV